MRSFILTLALLLAVVPTIDAGRGLALKADPDCKAELAAAQQAYDDALAKQNQSITAMQVESPKLAANVSKATSTYDASAREFNKAVGADSTAINKLNLATNGLANAKAAYDQEVDLCKTPAPPADCDEKTKELKTALDAANITQKQAQIDKLNADLAKDNADKAMKDAYSAMISAQAWQQSELTRLNTAIQTAGDNVATASANLADVKAKCPQPAGLVTLKADPDCKAELAAAEQQYKDALAAQTTAVDALTTESKTLASNVSKAAATHDADASDYNHKVAADATAKNNANKAKNDMANAQAAYTQEVNLCKTPAPPADCDEKKKELKTALANATSAKKEADDALAAADLAEENAKKAMDDAYDALVSAQAYQVKELARLNEAIQTAGDNVAKASSNLADVKAKCPQPAGRVTSVALSR